MSEKSVLYKTNPPLREGFTTGTCATAALIAAMELLYTGKVSPGISVPLPPFPNPAATAPQGEQDIKWVRLSPASAAFGPASSCDLELLYKKNSFCKSPLLSHATVIKDGGDDPDITHGLPVRVTLTACRELGDCCPLPYTTGFLQIIAGKGVGMVTRPGLPVPPGEAAINPGPRSQLLFAASFYFNKFIRQSQPFPPIHPPFTIIISVPGGEDIASQTLNPKLGIRGGISILGTRGIVRPFSNKAWKETIRQEISFAKASGLASICLSTGRRSEEFLKSLYPWLPPSAFVQAGDLAATALSLARQAGFKHILWGCFFGKLCKLAQGLPNTHACEENLDLDKLADICLSERAIHAENIRHCNTAREALDLVLQENNKKAILNKLMLLARNKLEKYAGQPVVLHLFHEDGRELARL